MMESKNAYMIDKNDPELIEIIRFAYLSTDEYLADKEGAANLTNQLRILDIIKKNFPITFEDLQRKHAHIT